MNAEDCTLIGVDWGTSRLRAFRIGNEGQILDRRSSDQGIAHLAAGGFDPVLRETLTGWAAGVPILMCGMVGSRQGWREVAYCPCPAGAKELANNLFPLATSAGPAWIVGGVSSIQEQNDVQGRSSHLLDDVMRGEETQIVGIALPPGDSLVITPGTHSKWTRIRAGCIEGFRTCMTGEVYELLRRYSILGRFMHPDLESRFDEGSFLDGVGVGIAEPALLHSLFSVRTRALLGRKPHSGLEAYLSGILIGSEVSGEAHCLGCKGSTIVIAGLQLGRLYQLALAAGGFDAVELVDADTAVAKGLWHLWQLRGTAS
jgi:2-dehydro-3-deoxygalactonokinase